VAYGTTDELARRLQIRAPTAAQTEQLQSVLDAASTEINWDLGYDTDLPPPVSSLVVNACYGRARELWNLGYATFGGTLLGTDLLAYAGNDSWLRWHRLLDPLRVHEGIA
jgi:hypothetical protein